MNTQIEFYVKNVWGKDLRYIIDPQIRSALTTLTGTGTLCDYQLKPLESLGFTFKEVLQPR